MQSTPAKAIVDPPQAIVDSPIAALVGRTQPVREESVVMRQTQEAPGYFRLRLQAPMIAAQVVAGQFLHVLPRANTASTFDPLLRRAFSVMRVEGEELELLYRAGGRGTNVMASWREGERADVLGPLGRGFGALHARNFLVGGGVGVPPMVILAARAASEKRDAIALVGARGQGDVLCARDFAALQVPCEIATEDGSVGVRGRVTDLLLPLLADVKRENSSYADRKVFACGPLPMLRAVAQLCARFEVACEVSLEEAMPCGVGVCNGCVVPVVAEVGGDEYGSYRRICVEGPVLPASEVDWSRL